MSLRKLESRLREHTNPEKAKILQRFFKTGEGQYGEGDVFLGIVVPIQRQIVSEFKDLVIDDVQKLLDSKVHEKRLIGVLILIEKYKKADASEKKQIFDFYLKNAKNNNINNWDLVDLSAPNIVGNFLLDKVEERSTLYKLAESNNLWEKRISIIATLTFIRNKEFEDSLKISKILLNDSHDLIHKAVGWMLREIGKRDVDVLRKFLKDNYQDMPRTMLRYSIEKFEEDERKGWLQGEI